MSFPVEPGVGEVDERGLFLVQAPDIRAKVLPLFSFDPRRSNDSPVGHGTAFRIDPWSRCLTAFHVLEDLFEVDEAGTGAVLRPGLRLAALEVEGTGFGLIGVRSAISGSWSNYQKCCKRASCRRMYLASSTGFTRCQPIIWIRPLPCFRRSCRGAQSNSRRSNRQFAQGFGQTAAALR